VIPPPAVPEPLTGAVAPGAIPFPTWETKRLQARDHLTTLARALTTAGQSATVAIREGDPATQIVAYAAGEPDVIGIAMATHGWGGLERLILGSVVEQVLHNAPRPLLLVRPQHAEGAVRVPPARPYRTILVPLDGSSQAEAALAPARTLAAAADAELVLLTVTPAQDDAEMAALAGLGPPPQTHDAESSAYLARTLHSLHDAAMVGTTRLSHGEPAASIMRCANEVDADLIVMATHGPGGIDRLWHGSVAQEVLEHALRPVLLIRVLNAPAAAGS
jgi:nucleotide-binding universal stress UspA family protein